MVVPMLILLIVNTVLCVIGFIPSFGVQLATVMGGAADGVSGLGTGIALAGFVFPALPVISIIGSWVGYKLDATGLVLACVSLPWVYLLALGAAVLVFTRQP